MVYSAIVHINTNERYFHATHVNYSFLGLSRNYFNSFGTRGFPLFDENIGSPFFGQNGERRFISIQNGQGGTCCQ
jgi:hypothetical protein